MCYGYHIWSKEAIQAEMMPLDGGQVIRGYVPWLTIFGQKNCPDAWMMTLMEVKGHQRSNADGKLCAMATIFGQKKR